MRETLAAIPLLFLPLTALAAGPEVSVSIVSPAAGSCYNNTDTIFTGAVLGGQAGPPVRPVQMNLSLTDNNGNGVADVISVEILANGLSVDRRQFMAPGDGVAFETGPFDVFQVEDGAQVDLTAIATVGAASAQDDVALQIDRAPPAVVSDAAIPDPRVCNAIPPPVQYHLRDNQDANPPAAVERIEFPGDGCDVRRIISVRDTCGNRQEVSATSRRPAPPGSVIGVAFAGVDEGARVGSATLTYDISGPQGCVDTLTSTLTRDGLDLGPVFSGQEIADQGNYTATVQVSSCGTASPQAVRHFTVLATPVANAGGPYTVEQDRTVRLCGTQSHAAPELGGIIGYHWDTNNDGYYDPREGSTECIDFDASVGDGVYPVRLKVESGNHAFAEVVTTVTVTDVTPTCVLQVPDHDTPEGVPAEFDASASTDGNIYERIQLYEWDFGDNNPPMLAVGLVRPTHSFMQPGDYTVTLHVHDIDSACVATGRVHITDVAPICHSAQASQDGSLVEGQPVQFTSDTEPGSGSAPITDIAWEFGDGDRQSGALNYSATHTYQNDGDFRVNVVVSDATSHVNCAPFEVHVADLEPVAELAGAAVAMECDRVDFNALNTRAGGDADPLASIDWDFGDNTPVVHGNPNVLLQNHVFNDNGTFTVTLTARDEDSSTSATRSITIFDASPTAEFEAHYPDGSDHGHEGEPMELDASLSTAGAPCDPIGHYLWDFGDGETTEGADKALVQHAWPDEGDYTVRVTVTDEDGSESTAEHTVHIVNVAPTVELSIDDPEPEIGVSYTFTATVHDVPGDIISYTWDMGDDSPPETDAVVQHAYQLQGPRVITVHVDDGDGGTARAELAVTVTRARPRINCSVLPDLGDEFQGTEGEELQVSCELTSVENEPGQFDGPLLVPEPQLPSGAGWEIRNGVPPEQHKTAVVTWTPSYMDAGQVSFIVRGVAPSGLTRDVEVVLNIAEAGTPYAAAGSVVNGEGRVTVVEYGRDPLSHGVTFEPRSEVSVGSGMGSLAASEDGRWVFAATPGSGGIGVVDMWADPPAFGRLIRTGAETVALAVGGDRVYSISAADGTLSTTDTTTLKLLRSIPVAPVVRPLDIVYVPAGVGGLPSARILVVGGNGQIALIDPTRAEAGGNNAILASRHLGGVLQRAALDATAAEIHIADGKTRTLYTVGVAELVADFANANLTSTSLTFGARDLAAADGTLWAPTSGGLAELGGGAAPTFHRTEHTPAIAIVSDEVYPGGGVLMMSPDGLDHRSGDLDLVLHTTGRPSTRRLAAFVTLH